MKIMVHRNGVDYGPFTPEEARARIVNGELKYDDMASLKGTAGRKALRDVLATPPKARSMFATSRVTRNPQQQAQPEVPAAKPLGKKAWWIAGAVLVFIIIVVLVELKQISDVLAPFLGLLDTPSKPTVRFSEFTMTQNGDRITAQLKTDDAHPDELCDEVMDRIYDLSWKNPSAESIDLTVQAGEKTAVVRVDNLGVVRALRDGAHYENSPHRPYVGQPLVDAGLMDEASLAVKALHSGADDLIGATYQNSTVPPPGTARFGVRFVDDTQAEALSDGVRYGAMCKYTVEGDIVTLETSCSTDHFQIKGDDLISTDGDGMSLSRVDP